MSETEEKKAPEEAKAGEEETATPKEEESTATFEPVVRVSPVNDH